MYSYRHQASTVRHSFKLLILLFIFIFLAIWTYVTLRNITQPVISPLPDNLTPAKKTLSISFTSKKKGPEELKKKINKEIGNTWKNFSVYVVDYTSDFIMGINETVIFTAASVNKIPILATLYYEAQNQTINLADTVTLQQSDIQDYGTGTIRYDPPGTTYSIKTLARLMMQKSDNTAAFLLANYIVGFEKVQQLIDSWGLIQTNMEKNTTSNKDIALLMEKIYKEKVANRILTQEILAFLKDSDFEDRIPALLPDVAVVYHKTGNGIGNVHDVGIVVTPKKVYYIGILTSDIANEEEAIKLSAKISKIVYDYLN